jgi:hypothetical protein
MSCKSNEKFSSAEQSSKSFFRTKGAIDSSLNIINEKKFNALNTEWSTDAAVRYNTDGTLFTNVEDKAIANSELFKQIDVAKAPETQNVSVASPATIARMKEAAVQMGINLTGLSDYAKVNPEVNVSGINGVADLTQGIIAIAEGHEDVALTEEMVHMGSAIIEAKDPRIITNLISKIGDFKIYKEVLDAYKGKKAYQLPNGKPDIRKIKKEAVDKLMAEAIMNEGQNSEMYPELADLTTLGKVKQWWNNLLRHISGMYKQSTIDIFEKTAESIAEGNVGTALDIDSQGVFFQVAPVVENTAVNEMFDKVAAEDKRLQLFADEEIPGKPRHYAYTDPISGEVKDVDLSVTQAIKLNKRGPAMQERTGINAIQDASKMKWGSAGHEYIEEMMNANLIDKETGYAREVFGTQVIDARGLQPEVVEKLEIFAKALIRSYKEPGTKFLIEPKVINKKNKNKTLASAIDFMALVPSVKDGKPDVKVEMLDWKFTTTNNIELSAGDIPWFKRDSWKSQMGEYSKMLRGYGMRQDQLQKARMIPFMMTYENIRQSHPGEGLYASKIEIGDINNLEEVATHLLPVPIQSEPSGVDAIDKLLFELNAYYKRNFAYQGDLSADEKQEKQDKLNSLQIAIRRLHVARDFAPLVQVGKNFIKAADSVFRDFDAIDYKTADAKDIRKLLKRLSSLKKDSRRFEGINKAFLETHRDKEFTEKDKQTIKDLGDVATQVETMMQKIIDLENDRAVFINVENGWETEENKESILAPTREIKGLEKLFSEGSKLPNKRAEAIAALVLQKKGEVEINFNKAMDKFRAVFTPLNELAKSKGVTPFSLIGKIGKGGNTREDAEDTLQVFEKVKPEFMKDLAEARKDKNKDFVKKNIDMVKHDAAIKAQMERQEAEIRSSFHSSDEGENEIIASMKVDRMKNALDINRKGFNGWHSHHFIASMYESIKKDDPKYQTEEYKNMAKDKAALDAWNYITEWSDRAKEHGHIPIWKDAFFPLIEADALAKFAQSGDSMGTNLKEFFTDAITGRIDESKSYSNIDEETGEARQSIPVFYTKSNKKAELMTQDISKAVPMWMHSILDFEASLELEGDLNNLVEVEENVGRLIVDAKNKIQRVAGKEVVSTKSNANLPILKTIVRDAVYGQTEDTEEIGNQNVSGIAKMFTKGDKFEDQMGTEIRVKKILQGANMWVRHLGVGLKPALAVANTVGNVMLSFIYKSGVYRYREYLANTTKVMSNQLDTKDKAILDFISPFSENNVIMQRRKSAKEGKNYLEFINTFSISDIIQRTNSFPEEILQMINGQSMIDNVVVIKGKLVNVRELILAEDRATKASGISQEERKALNDSYEDRVAKRLKSETTLKSVAKVSETGIDFPGVSVQELAKLRVKILDHSRNLNGQMDNDDKAAYRRSIIMNSFMMFKHWIPKLITGRFQGIKKNQQAGHWEYGRSRLLAKVAVKLMETSLTKMSDLINQTDVGIAIMDEMLEDKKNEYFDKTGQVLTITKEEWYDLMNQELSRQVREFGVVLAMVSLLVLAKAAEPPEDVSAQDRNRFNYLIRVMNKVADEVLFFYNPLSFEGMTSGSIMPAVGLLSKGFKAVGAIAAETGALGEDAQEKAHAAKYILNMIPIGYQVSKTLVPLVDQELAKEMGNVIAKETNRR